MTGEAGKGDTRRPRSISDKEYSKAYDRVFGKKPRWFETKEHKEWVKKARKDQKKIAQKINAKRKRS